MHTGLPQPENEDAGEFKANLQRYETEKGLYEVDIMNALSGGGYDDGLGLGNADPWEAWYLNFLRPMADASKTESGRPGFDQAPCRLESRPTLDGEPR